MHLQPLHGLSLAIPAADFHDYTRIRAKLCNRSRSFAFQPCHIFASEALTLSRALVIRKSYADMPTIDKAPICARACIPGPNCNLPRYSKCECQPCASGTHGLIDGCSAMAHHFTAPSQQF